METDSDRIGKGINPESSSVETDFLTLDRHQRRFQETGGIQVSFRPNPAVSAGGSDETPGIQWGQRGDWGQKEIRTSGCHGFTVFGKEVASSFDNVSQEHRLTEDGKAVALVFDWWVRTDQSNCNRSEKSLTAVMGISSASMWRCEQMNTGDSRDSLPGVGSRPWLPFTIDASRPITSI